MKAKQLTIGALLIGILFLSGCGDVKIINDPVPNQLNGTLKNMGGPGLMNIYQYNNDEVQCYILRDGYGGGISCKRK